MSHLRTTLGILLAVALLAPFAACDDGGTPPDQVDPTSWRASWSIEQLTEFAKTIGVNLVEEGESSVVSKEDVVAALEQATGCGCFGATCGTGYCGHECGGCGADDTCFAGLCESATSCPVTALSAGSQEAKLVNDTESLKFRYETTLTGATMDKVRISYNAAVDGAVGPGTYDLRQQGLNDCKPCVTGHNLCPDEGTSCNFNFMATAGKLTIEEITPDGKFKGSLTEARFQAVYEDPKTGVFTLQPQPINVFAPRCTDSFSFDTTLVSEVIEPQECDPEGNGTSLGNKIADFQLTNCLGEAVQLHSGCGKKALWLIAAAGW